MGEPRFGAGERPALATRAHAATRAVAIKPHYAEAHYLLAVTAANQRDFAAATHHLRRGLALDPKHPGLNRLAEQLTRAGRLEPNP